MKTFIITKVTTFAVYAILSVVLSSCDAPKSAHGKSAEIVSEASLNYPTVIAKDYSVSGMHYKVFHLAGGNIFVINVTRDSLDIVKNFHIGEN